jgi:hypothetical protein
MALAGVEPVLHGAANQRRRIHLSRRVVLRRHDR